MNAAVDPIGEVSDATRVAIVCSFVAAGIAFLAAGSSACGFSVTITPILGFIALPRLLNTRAIAIFGPVGRVYAAMLPLTFVPLIALRAATDIAERSALRDNRERLAQTSETFWLLTLVLVVPVGTLAMRSAWRLLRKHRGPKLEGFLRRAALLTTAAGGLLVGVAVLSTVRRLPADAWATSLPVVAEVSPSRWRHEGPLSRNVTAGGEVTARCGPSSSDCLHYFRPQGAREALGPVRFDPLWQGYRIRHDARNAFYVVESFGTGPTSAFTDSGVRTDITVSRVSRSVAPPPLWTLASIVGLLVAMDLQRRGRRQRAREGAGRWLEGRATVGGVAILSDGRCVLAPDAVTGETVVASDVGAGVATFRDAGIAAASAVVVGTIADRREEARLFEAAHSAWALGVGLLAITPLAVFSFAGFVP